MPNSLRARLKNLVHKGVLTQKDFNRIVIVPVDGNGDLISRQALKDLGAECIAKRDENGNLIPLGSIDSLPSVSTEKTGRFEWVQYDFDVDGLPIAKHCPNRGCRMMEVEE